MKSYCLKCKRKTETVNMSICPSTKNPRLKGTCLECGSNKSTYITKDYDKEIK